MVISPCLVYANRVPDSMALDIWRATTKMATGARGLSCGTDTDVDQSGDLVGIRRVSKILVIFQGVPAPHRGETCDQADFGSIAAALRFLCAGESHGD